MSTTIAGQREASPSPEPGALAESIFLNRLKKLWAMFKMLVIAPAALAAGAVIGTAELATTGQALMGMAVTIAGLIVLNQASKELQK